MLIRRPRGDDGAVAIVVALLAVTLFGVAALAVDLGAAYQRRRATQTTADLAALAGAQSLPNQSAARASAMDYVGRNLAPGGPLPGAGWDSDGSTANGEITVTGTSVRVVVPPREVKFGLAGALGFRSTSVSAAATAGVTSPRLNVLPVFLTETEAANGYACLKDTPKGQAGPGALANCTVSTGDFGWLDIARSGAPGQTLDDNIALGADHLLSTYTGSLPVGATCSSSTPGVVVDAPGIDGANCVDIANGNKVSAATGGFLTGVGSTAGRLEQTHGDQQTGTIGRYAPVDTDTFASYLNVPLPTFLANVSHPTPGWVDAAILDCPRFAIVPVLHVVTNPQNGRYAISGFRGVFLDAFQMNGGGTQIVGVTAYVFPLDALPSILPADSVSGTSPYTGFGPRITSLTE